MPMPLYSVSKPCKELQLEYITHLFFVSAAPVSSGSVVLARHHIHSEAKLILDLQGVLSANCYKWLSMRTVDLTYDIYRESQWTALVWAAALANSI